MKSDVLGLPGAPHRAVSFYRCTKISTQVSGIDSIASALVQDLTHAENTIYNDGLEYVEPDSPEARWPSS